MAVADVFFFVQFEKSIRQKLAVLGWPSLAGSISAFAADASACGGANSRHQHPLESVAN
jgi:hypothetical protein